MKKTLTLLTALIIAEAITAQVPEKMSYQAVIRDAFGNLVTEQQIRIRISILRGTANGTTVYSETQTPATNMNGLASFEIGGAAGFTDIDWSDGPYFLKTETDPGGGTNYTISGTSQLLTVPYALHAKTAGTVSGPIEESDPEFAAWNRSEGIIISESQISDLQNYYLDSNPEGFITTDLNNENLSNLADPIHAQDAATKAYVDNLIDNLLALLNRLEVRSGITGCFLTDIDDNVYQTVFIGLQEWMTENLRTKRYRNGDAIPTGHNLDEWHALTTGAYTIYPHGDIEGLDSEEEVLAAYGALYNWYAVETGNLCPAGWRVPGHDDWVLMEQYVCNELNNADCSASFPESTTIIGWRGTNEGNALKSCRQVDSPLNEDCAVSDHPRWNYHKSNFGNDEFKFGALPGGVRISYYDYLNTGTHGHWWTSTQNFHGNPPYFGAHAWYRVISRHGSQIDRSFNPPNYGMSVRCIKDRDCF